MDKTLQKIYSYFATDPTLRVLFIFNDMYLRDELSAATWQEGYRYVIFQGNWFTCKYMLDTAWKDDKVVLYFDSLSPLQSKEAMEHFPLLDVLMANKVYTPGNDYVAYMLEHHLPMSMTSFVKANIRHLLSAKVDDILLPCYADGNVNTDVATRAILAAFLSKGKLLSWDELLTTILLLGRYSERERQDKFLRSLATAPDICESLQTRLTDIFGTAMDLTTEAKVESIVQALKYNAIVQQLPVVPADNYAFLRVDNALSLQRLNSLLDYAHSAALAPAFDELLTELGGSIRCEELVRWYGIDANYHFLPTDLCTILLRHLMDSDLAKTPRTTLAQLQPLADNSHTPLLNDIITFLHYVAQYYDAVSTLPLDPRVTPADHVRYYENHFFRIDQLYRLVVEAYYAVAPDSDLFDSVKRVKTTLDYHYHQLTNLLNLAWTDSLRTTGLAALSLPRQWQFYDDRLRTASVKVAVIVCDALRYELAKQITSELSLSKHTATLVAAIATLPTETKFCKPALLPHRALQLVTRDSQDVDMMVDGRVLADLSSRSAHLQGYRDNAICIDYKTVAEYDIDKNRQIFKHPLVYIFHNDIDEAGHSNDARQITARSTQAVRDIVRLIRSLHASFNVTEVYVTADHGFLFNDLPLADNDKLSVAETTVERKARYYLTPSSEPIDGVMKYPLSTVSGMTDSDLFVAVPEGTNRFLAPAGGYAFAHGGATMQEMLIPIIISHVEKRDKKEPVGVDIPKKALVIKSSKLLVALMQTEAVSATRKPREVLVALYHHDQPASIVKRLRLASDDSDPERRKQSVSLTLSHNIQAKMVEVRVYDVNDKNNPLIRREVRNSTLIEPDFD